MNNPRRTSVNAQPRNCLICTVPIQECHLGIDSCRACCVFYKRTVKMEKDLIRCKKGTDDCIENEPTTNCRKCRFRKFCDVLERAFTDEQREVEETEDEYDTDNGQRPSTSFIDHNSFTLTPSLSNETPLLSRIRHGYSLFCIVRKSGEFHAIPDDYAPSYDDIEENKIHFFPLKYSKIHSIAKVFMASLYDFGNATFEDFRSLSPNDKSTIISTSYKLVNMLEATYRAVHYFPDCDTGLPGYTFMLNGETIEYFFDDCPHSINKVESIDACRRNMGKLNRMSKEYYKKVMPTDAEFVLLLGLAFWNHEISTVNKKLAPLVDRNRSAVNTELHVLYKKEGRTDYASRLGELYCLMANLEEVCTLAEEDTELYRLMNFFNESATQ